MAGLCEGSNESAGSLKAIRYPLECVTIPLATWHSVGQWKLAPFFGGYYAVVCRQYCSPVGQSPDLNPIEHLWDELDLRLRSREMRPTSIVQLNAMLQEEWRFIPVDILQVGSMPDRVAAVIATRGGTTRF
ncbi:hypothetical protein ANN_04944 [Periplaneta americana]|uniref:Uncharacterized protein n=1 Tax=Periplaneta americana TaxID=6978 RepID=A0ABQ8T9R4_PERAM|nr:hypothetical protein ANN_04944 [Periplaneta americana]